MTSSSSSPMAMWSAQGELIIESFEEASSSPGAEKQHWSDIMSVVASSDLKTQHHEICKSGTNAKLQFEGMECPSMCSDEKYRVQNPAVFKKVLKNGLDNITYFVKLPLQVSKEKSCYDVGNIFMWLNTAMYQTNQPPNITTETLKFSFFKADGNEMVKLRNSFDVKTNGNQYRITKLGFNGSTYFAIRIDRDSVKDRDLDHLFIRIEIKSLFVGITNFQGKREELLVFTLTNDKDSKNNSYAKSTCKSSVDKNKMPYCLTLFASERKETAATPKPASGNMCNDIRDLLKSKMCVSKFDVQGTKKLLFETSNYASVNREKGKGYSFTASNLDNIDESDDLWWWCGLAPKDTIPDRPPVYPFGSCFRMCSGQDSSMKLDEVFNQGVVISYTRTGQGTNGDSPPYKYVITIDKSSPTKRSECFSPRFFYIALPQYRITFSLLEVIRAPYTKPYPNDFIKLFDITSFVRIAVDGKNSSGERAKLFIENSDIPVIKVSALKGELYSGKTVTITITNVLKPLHLNKTPEIPDSLNDKLLCTFMNKSDTDTDKSSLRIKQVTSPPCQGNLDFDSGRPTTTQNAYCFTVAVERKEG